MEYLDSSWMTLSDSDYSTCPNPSISAASIRLSIDKVLDIPEKSGKVHGDLQTVNIMVNFSPNGKIILVNGKQYSEDQSCPLPTRHTYIITCVIIVTCQKHGFHDA